MTHAWGRIRLFLFTALVATVLTGCAPLPGAARASRPRAAGRRSTAPVRYQLVVRDAPGEGSPSLIVELKQRGPAHGSVEPSEGQAVRAQARPWRFRPGFLLLPLAPVQAAIGLGGAGGLAAGFAVTFPLRIVAGAVGTGACAVGGSREAAGDVWEWGWDSKRHAQFWGVHPEDGDSLMEQCVSFAFDYSRYSLSPVLPEAPPSAEHQPGATAPVEKVTVPPAIQELSATVRASRPDAAPFFLPSPLDAPTIGPVIFPIGSAIGAFCHDDELALELVAVLGSGEGQRVSGSYTTRVSRWRKPGGPRIRWRAPAGVVLGGTVANPVSTRELPVRILLRADTPDSPITLWEIKQDGKVRGGAIPPRGQAGLGRAIEAAPEGKIEFKRPGDRTTLEVVVEAGETLKASSVATFVFSPDR